MTPAEEARFIALWNAGTETAEIGRQLGIPVGTVSSRAATLARQGKIQRRPKGGNYPRSTAQGRSGAEGRPSTVHGPPGHLGVEALGPLDRLCAPGHAGGVAAPGRRPWAEPEPVGAGSPGTVAGGGSVSDGK
jgi:hypothetical protein